MVEEGYTSVEEDVTKFEEEKQEEDFDEEIYFALRENLLAAIKVKDMDTIERYLYLMRQHADLCDEYRVKFNLVMEVIGKLRK